MSDDRTFLSIQPGDTLLGRYRLERVLGRGGMGVVWKAQDLQLSKPVAVKLLPPELVHDQNALDRLKAEARRGQSLAHPGIVTLHDFQQDPVRGNIAFLVMEFVEGKTLSDLLKDHRQGLPLERVVKWARQMAEAIDFAHSKEILHRDIKPGNVMIDAKDNARLIDFGIGREVRNTMSQVSVRPDSSGTPAYMSPQQLMGENHKSNDIYSLAATVYECVGGRPPFVDGHIPTQIAHKPAASIAGQPNHVNAALLAGLAKKPDQRPATARLLVEAMVKTVAEVPLPPSGARAAPSPKRASPASNSMPRTQSRRRWWVIAALVVLIGAGASFAVYQHEQSRAAEVARQREETRLAEEKRLADARAAEETRQREADSLAKQQQQPSPQAQETLIPSQPAPSPSTTTTATPAVVEMIDNPRVVIDTSMGTIMLELYPEQAPYTVRNFLHYVDSNFYDGTIFHRVVRDFVIQGGGYTPDLVEKPHGPAIKNESRNGLKNIRGAVSAARMRNPDSASAQFFINVVDNPHLDQGTEFTGNAGYAVFGLVVSGMDVVDRIRLLPTNNINNLMHNVPTTAVVIRSIRRVEDFGHAATMSTGAKLAVGSPAPAISVGQWVSNAPAEVLPLGRVHVVTFFATWCPVCRANMHLVGQAYSKVKQKGGQVIAVSVWERGEADVAGYVRERSSVMSFPVATDTSAGPEGQMSRTWLAAAGVKGIPSTFIIGVDGRIEWIGHPQGLAEALDRTLALTVPSSAGSPQHLARKTVEFAPGVTAAFVYIDAPGVAPDGFLMGSPASEEGREDDETQHRVKLTKGFWMQTTEVTQAQWMAVMDSNPSKFTGDPRLPVEMVSWDNCQQFISRARARGIAARLPTEAEWEFACRAGTMTPFSFGATISTEQANYDGNYTYFPGRKGVYREKTTPVGVFPANAWGLQDMGGNVWEWCQDLYGAYPIGSAAMNPTGPQIGSHRVVRGGSWDCAPSHLRSARRNWGKPSNWSYSIGVRLCLDSD